MERPIAYEGQEAYIFISYAHKDSETVLPLITLLQAQGFRVWYDAGIEIGSEWPEYIAEHLYNSGCVIAFLSDAALQSPNCRQEINFAIDERKPLLVAYLEDVALTLGMRMRLNTSQAVFCQKHTPEEVVDMLATLQLLAPCKAETAVAEEVPAVEDVPVEEETPATEEIITEPVPSQEEIAEEKPEHDPIAVICFQEAKELMAAPQKDHIQIYTRLKKSADLGHPEAMFHLAGYLLFPAHPDLGGKPALQNVAKAIDYYKQTADVLPESLFALGYCHQFGIGLPQNTEEAQRLFEKAAAANFEDAAIVVQAPTMTAQGCYTLSKASRDTVDSSFLMRSALLLVAAASKPDIPTDAMLALGRLFSEGLLVQKNETEAKSWYTKAIFKGHSKQNALSHVLQLQKKKQFTHEFFTICEVLLEQGVEECALLLGECYFSGYGVSANYTKAFSYFLEGAENFHTGCMAYLNYCYRKGLGVEKSIFKALYWYGKAVSLDPDTYYDTLQYIE